MGEIKSRENYTLLPVPDNSNCFCCGSENSKGLHMRFYLSPEEDSVASWIIVPDYLAGWGNIVHGGIVSALLDEAMGWACLILHKKPPVSKSIKVDFVKPVYTGREIKVEGRVSKINSEREAVLEGTLYDDKSEICAMSSSVVALFSVEAMEKIGIKL